MRLPAASLSDSLLGLLLLECNSLLRLHWRELEHSPILKSAAVESAFIGGCPLSLYESMGFSNEETYSEASGAEKGMFL